MLRSVLGKVINIDQGSPGPRVGKLLDINHDHFVLLTEENGVVYYNSQHLKSVKVDRKGFNSEILEDLEYKKADNLQSLLEAQMLQWVKINRDSPEQIEGILYEVNNDIISLINNDELIRISMFHLRNISIA